MNQSSFDFGFRTWLPTAQTLIAVFKLTDLKKLRNSRESITTIAIRPEIPREVPGEIIWVSGSSGVADVLVYSITIHVLSALIWQMMIAINVG